MTRNNKELSSVLWDPSKSQKTPGIGEVLRGVKLEQFLKNRQGLGLVEKDRL